jgi:hypothetical protein
LLLLAAASTTLASPASFVKKGGGGEVKRTKDDDGRLCQTEKCRLDFHRLNMITREYHVGLLLALN